MAIEDVVAEDERDAVTADEIAADDEGLGEAVRRWLHRVGQLDPERRPSPSNCLKERLVLRGRDNQDLADARHHQGGERIVDHRLVVDGQQLLRDHERQRIEPRAGSAGEYDAFHRAHPSILLGLERRNPRRLRAGQHGR